MSHSGRFFGAELPVRRALRYVEGVRRAFLFLTAFVAGVSGCGMIAGLDEQFGYPAHLVGDAAHDGTVAQADGGSEGGDGPASAPDVVIPDDVYTPDGGEAVPDAAEAGCTNPIQSCDTAGNRCCAPAVCNAVAKCVGKCVDGNGCGDEAACCYGKHCGELFSCVGTCAQNGADCNVFGGAFCCLGSVCPPTGSAKCRTCLSNDEDCGSFWECCSKKCTGGKCR